MNDTRRTALIAIDWGTTSARAYRIDGAGGVLAERTAALGIQSLLDQPFAPALDTLLATFAAPPGFVALRSAVTLRGPASCGPPFRAI